jgi:hypothetical protein
MKRIAAVLLIPLIFVCVILAPVMWQGIKEYRTRNAVRKNLQSLQKAVDAYEANQRSASNHATEEAPTSEREHE